MGCNHSSCNHVITHVITLWLKSCLVVDFRARMSHYISQKAIACNFWSKFADVSKRDLWSSKPHNIVVAYGAVRKETREFAVTMIFNRNANSFAILCKLRSIFIWPRFDAVYKHVASYTLTMTWTSCLRSVAVSTMAVRLAKVPSASAFCESKLMVRSTESVWPSSVNCRKLWKKDCDDVTVRIMMTSLHGS